jgi:hypothetical protein
MPIGSAPLALSPANLLAYQDPVARALGFKAVSGILNFTTAALTPVSQTIYCSSVWLNAGDVVSNVAFNVATAGAGAPPTSIFVGLCDATTMRAQSGNVNGNAQWVALSGYAILPLSASYTALASALHYVMFLQDGAWGTTQMTLNRANNIGPTQGTTGSTFVYATAGTGQTALPGNGTPVTLASAGASNLIVCVS